MNVQELHRCREHRTEGETISQTRERLEREGMFSNADQAQKPEPPDSPDEIFSDSDFTIPRWKLVQPSCRIEGATVGMFRNTLTDEEVSKLECVVFLIQYNTRSLFVEDDFSGDRLCWSQTGYIPAREHILMKTGQEPQSPVCASKENGKLKFHCHYAQWRNQTGEPDPNGMKPPVCKASIAFLGLDSIRMPFWVIFHGAALPVVKDFLRYIVYKKEEGKRQGKMLQLHDFKITVGLQLQSTAKGKFYLPRFEKREIISDSTEQALLLKCYESLNGRFLPDSMEQSEEEE